MSEVFVLSIDQGTTGSTAVVIKMGSGSAEVVAKANVPFKQHFPQPGWVEHDLGQIWESVSQAVSIVFRRCKELDNAFSAKLISAIGITNQRETLCVFDKLSTLPIERAIVWQCRRSAEICEDLKKRGFEETIKSKTGLVLDPYFTGSKLKWLMNHRPEVAAKIKSGEALVGTIDSFLIYRLTGGRSFCTEPSNASRTMLFDIHKGDYCDELLEMFEVPNRSVLPEVKDSAGLFGVTNGCEFLPDGIPITGVLGDQQAALAGQACFSKGQAKCTYGTGAFLLLNAGTTCPSSANGLLSTVAWRIKGKITYALEGSSFVAGAAIQFLRDQMNFLSDSSESEAMASSCQGSPEVYFVPALTGLGAPYWNPHAKGAFFGLTRGTSKQQLVRAGLEGIAFQVNDLIETMQSDTKIPMTSIKVDGGACSNGLLMQLQADYTNLEIDRPKNLETTVFGVSLLAGLGAGLFNDLSELSNLRDTDKVFVPNKVFDQSREASIAGWRRAVQAVELFSR